MDELTERNEPWLDGYRVKALDGNHLASTERRLEVLRRSSAGPLPGLALVVIDVQTELVLQMVGCEDAYTQERRLFGPVLDAININDVYIADRNFCTLSFLHEISKRDAFFIIRHHAVMPITTQGTLRRCGQTDNGEVFEQKVLVIYQGQSLCARRIVIRLHTPTRDGETELSILTNLPALAADATKITELYRKRWTVESLFARVERNLQSELSSLGYPGAALFAFAIALVASNIFAILHATMSLGQKQQRDPKIAQMPLSDFAIVEAVRTVHEGMTIILDDSYWVKFQTMRLDDFVKTLLQWTHHIDWRRFRKAIRGPKKSPPKRNLHKGRPHVSTARLLANT
jgi:hypothetical protein